MAKTPAASAATKPAEVIDPKLDLKAKLVEYYLAGKRWSADEAWMKDAVVAALNTKLDAKIAALTDAEVTAALAIFNWAK